MQTRQKKNPLAALVAQVLRTGCPATLSKADSDAFHRDFVADIGPEINRIRAERRKAGAAARNAKFTGVLLLTAGLSTGFLAGVVLGGMGMVERLAPAACKSKLPAPETAAGKTPALHTPGDTRLLIRLRRSGLSPAARRDDLAGK